MAINFNNQNQGIGTLDLSQFGLMQPQNQNMQVADAYNTPTEGEYGFNLIQLDRLKNAGYDPAELSTYPNQEDVQSIIRNLEPTANANNIMTDANVGTPSSIIEDEQGNLIDTENRVQFGNEKFDSEPYEYTPNYLGANSPMLDEGNTTISSLSNYGYDPAFGQLQNHFYGDTSYPGSGDTTGYFDDYLQKGQVPSLQRALGNERFALAPELTSQPQNLGFIEPATVPKEAIYQDRIMNNNLSNSNYEPKQGILQGLQDKIGAGFNNVKDGIMGSSAMDFLRGLPTPGNLLMNMANTRNPLSPRASNYNPTLQGQVDFMKDQGMYGTNPNTGLGQITGGRLTGKNLVSGFGSNDLGKMYSKDLSKLQGYLETMPQRFSRLMKNNPGSYQTKQNNLNKKIAQNKREAQQAQLAREASTANRARAANASVYANADAGGFTRGGGGFASHNTGTNSNFSNNTGRGRTGYQEGGLASMFTRRR